MIRKPLLFQANNGLSCRGEWIPPALYVTHQIFGFLGLRVSGYQVPMVMDSDSTCWLLMIMAMASSVIIALVTLEYSSCKMMCNTTRYWKKEKITKKYVYTYTGSIEARQKPETWENLKDYETMYLSAGHIKRIAVSFPSVRILTPLATSKGESGWPMPWVSMEENLGGPMPWVSRMGLSNT